MKCPKCSAKAHKARLDIYWCRDCNKAWLIHALKYRSFEEASQVVRVPPRVGGNKDG